MIAKHTPKKQGDPMDIFTKVILTLLAAEAIGLIIWLMLALSNANERILILERELENQKLQPLPNAHQPSLSVLMRPDELDIVRGIKE